MTKTLLLISGPAAVGKRPLIKALRQRAQNTEEVLIIASRERVSEPGRVWHGLREMRTDQIRALPADRYVIGSARGGVNAIDLQHIEEAFDRGAELVIVIPFYKLALSLVQHARVQALAQKSVRIVTVFISPFSRAELDICEDQREVLPMIMAGRDVERTLAEISTMQFGKVGFTNVYAAHHRATTLVDELESSAQFDHVLVLRNGHRPEVWASDPPAGEAGEVLSKLIAIVEQE